MKAQQFREKSIKELKEELLAFRKKQLHACMHKKTDENATPSHVFRGLRRDIARVKTVLREKNS